MLQRRVFGSNREEQETVENYVLRTFIVTYWALSQNWKKRLLASSCLSVRPSMSQCYVTRTLPGLLGVTDDYGRLSGNGVSAGLWSTDHDA